MVIQRWQSLLLLVAVVLMAIFCSTPYAIRMASEAAVTPSPVFVKDAPVFLVINLLVAALLFISIFLFKNLRLQMRVTLVSIILMVASLATCGFILWAAEPDAELLWTGGVILLLVALICAIAALRCMKRDYRLLKSYDRLL